MYFLPFSFYAKSDVRQQLANIQSPFEKMNLLELSNAICTDVDESECVVCMLLLLILLNIFIKLMYSCT